MFAQEVTKQAIGGQTGAVFAESWTSGSTGAYIVHGALMARTFEGEMKGALVVG
jgi:hypothetical protein